MHLAPLRSLDGNGEPQMDTALEDPWTLEGELPPKDEKYREDIGTERPSGYLFLGRQGA